MKKAVSILKKLYFVVIGGIVSSIFVALLMRSTNPGVGILILSVALLGSILAISLWLLSESYKSILKERIEFRSVMVGMLNLALFPIILFIMFQIGSAIEWFNEYVLEVYREIYGIRIPEFAITVLTTYLLYYAAMIPLMIRRLSRDIYMAKEEEGVIPPYKKLKIAREMSVMIRNRIILFLGAFGLAVVTHLSFLTRYYLAVTAVGLPILIVILIIYLASGISKAYQTLALWIREMISGRE